MTPMTPAELVTALEKQIGSDNAFSLSAAQATALGWTVVAAELDKTLAIAGSDATTKPAVTALAEGATVVGSSTYTGASGPVWVTATFALDGNSDQPSGVTVAAMGPVDALYAVLETFVKANVFALSAADATTNKWTAAAALLTKYAPDKMLTIDGTDDTTPPVLAKDEANNAVTVTGPSAAFFNGQSASAPLAAVATFTVDAEGAPNPALAIVAQLDDKWTFGKSFAKLAGKILDKFEFKGATADETATLTLDKDGLAFSGTPLLTFGPLGDLAWLFEGVTTIPVPNLAGPIDITDPDNPAFSYTFPAGTVPTVTLGPVSAALQLTLSSAASGYSAKLLPTIALDTGPVGLVADLSTTPYTFGLNVAPFTIPSLKTLDALAPGSAIETFVPDALKLPSLQVSDLTFTAQSNPDGGITGLGVTIALSKDAPPWTIIAGAIDVKSGSLTLAIAYDEKKKVWNPSLAAKGTFAIGSGDPPPASIDVTAALPAQTVTGTLTPGTTIDVFTLIAQFLGAAGIPAPGASWFGLDKLTVTKFDVSADGKQKIYHLELTFDVTTSWSIPLVAGPALELKNLDITFDRKTNAAPLVLTADVVKPLALTATAKRDIDAGNGWQLSLTQTKPIATGDLITAYFGDAGWVVAEFLPTIEDVALTLDTGTEAYTVAGTAKWRFTIGGAPVNVDATLALASELDTEQTPAKRTYTGTVTGSLTVFSFAASVAYQFGPDDKNVTYTIVFRGVTLTAVRATTADSDTLTVTLTGVTIGGVIEELVNLVVPNLGFSLPPPWDALSSVSLDGVTLVIDLIEKTVGVTASIGLDLVFASVNSVTLTYHTVPAGGQSVSISADISVAGTSTTESWDLLNDPAPTPPAASPPVVDLAFLGVGQNYGFSSATAPSTIQDVLAAMEREFDEDGPLSGLAFTGDGNWIVGIDVTLMGAVQIQVIFDDPVLYGVRIALSGEKVKSLAGLAFEILYRRITDTLGVYHIELTLPDKFRQMQFGAVSVTVPVIIIDIYTNGNFRLDFGFPVGGDFSNSFCVQTGPFIGYGGFYFALLDGQTSTTVPKVINGSFSPVIEFGLALSVGLGRTFNQGPLSAGATLTFEATIQGTLGWFNPTDRSQSTELFYHIEGTAALAGHVYGSVDLVIIKIDVDIRAKAQIALVAESYKAIELRFTADVEVEASVKIAFFTIHLSWGMSLDLSTSIGSASTPPWQLAGGGQNAFFSPQTGPVLRQQRSRHRPHRLRGEHLLARNAKRLRGPAAIDWTPTAVFPGAATQAVWARAVPVLTVAADDGVNPALHVVASFFVDNGIDPNARTATEVRTGGAPGSSFDSLAQGVLRWSFAAAGVAGLTGESGARVTSTAIAQLLTNLQDAAASEAAFSYDNVAGPTGFLAANYVVGFEPAQFDEQSGSLTVFPIPSAFSITPSDGSPVDLWNTACVDAAYRTQFETYYDQMRVAPASAEAGAGPHALRSRRLRAPHGFMRAESLPSSCPDGTTPLSAVVFGDYFALIAKSALQSASDLLTAYPYHATIGDSLASLAAEFGGGDAITVTARRGDTIASIAASLGIEPHVVARANAHLAGPRSLAHAAPLHARLHAGTDVTVPAGPTVGTIATANENVTLAPARGTLLTIDGVVTQVTSGQTMAGLASAFALGASAIFAGDGANASSTSLLRPGATGFMVPPIGYTVTAADMADDPADPLDRIGAVYYVRGNGPLGATAQQYVPWYMQQIGATGATGPSSTTEYVVPRASLSGGVIGATGATTSYAVRDQFDTLERVAKYFALIQLAEARPASFTQFVAEISAPSNVGPGTTIVIPTFSYAGATGDSLAGLAAIFSAGQTGQAALDPGALVGMNAGADVLQPLAVVNVPPFQATLESGDTLATIAQRYDLTVDALADSIAGATGIFAPGPTGGVTLTIPDVVSRDVDTLLGDMVARGEFNGLASTVSRFLMNGMRVAPVNDDPDWTPTAGLYSVIGQQLAAPAPGATLTLSFAAGPTAPWMAFYANGPTGPTSASLDVVLGATFIAANAPSLNLDPQIAGGPRGMTAYDDVPVRYPAPQNAHWQSATGPSLPGPTGGIAGQPSLWYFPPSLLAVTSQLSGATAATGPFEVVALAKNAQFGATATPPALERCAFAMTVELRIQRVLAADGNPIPNRYLLIGADETGRDLLLAAWQFARNGMRPFGDRLDQLYLLYAPPGAGNGSGFASDALGAGVVVLRTNLSTVTHPNRMMLAAAFGGDSSVFDAPITQPANFMQTVWEASITGSGGYYLQYQTAHGNGFPDGLFTGSPEATIRLVYLSFEQWSGQDQQLHPYTNCAVVGENVDAGSTTIYLNMPPGTGPTRRVATIPAGAVGFELTRVNPSGNTDAPDLTRSLYDVLSYRVESNPYFSESHFGRPIGPVSPAGATGTWLYRQIVPVAQFGLVNDGPTANSQAGFALPNPAQNPYAGITFGPGPTDAAQLSAARIDLFFNDVFGNAIGPSGTVAPVDVTAGYTDDLVAVSSWPGAALAYRLSATGPNGAQLSVDLTLDTTRAIPSSSLPVATANAAAVADAARYATVFYQVQQRDLTFALDCNLGVPHQQGDELKGPLAAFVTKAKLFADAASSLSPVTGYWFGGRGATFGAMARAFAVTPGALFAANPDAIVAAVFAPADGATQLLEPVLRAAQSPDTLASLAALGTYDLVALVTVNAAVPLRVGATLYAAAARTVPVVVTPAATLAATAAATSSAIYFVNGTSAETGLVVDNWTAANLVAPNLRITIGKTTKVTPAAPSSFADVYAQFSDADIDRGTFANAIAGVAGIWASGATQITSSSYWVQPVAPAQYKVAQPVTFGTIGTSLGPVETLVELNRAVPYLFVAGSVVQVGENSIALEPGTTFAEAAQQANLTLAQLGTANAAAPLQVFEQPPPVHSDIALTVPNLVELRERGWAAYTPISGDTLASIAAQFSPGDPVGATGALATLNRYLRGIITPGPIAIGGTSYTVTAGDSLDTLAARVGGGFDAFVAKAASVAGLFWPAAAVVVPGPALALNLTLAEVATGFGLSATDGVLSLFRANQSLRGFLAAGTRSVAFGPLKTTIEVGVYDTPGTLVQRLREEQGIDVTLDQLCTAVADIVGLLATGDVRYFMLPPNATPIATLLTPTIPPAGPAAYYPVTVSLGMSRAPELIVPDFAGTAVANVVTRISAAAFAAGATADGALLAFAQDFESAFAPFRLKCAVGDVPSAGGTDRASIYAVDFGPQGIAQLAIQADQPAFYSLPPISTSLVTGTYTVTDPSGATAAKSLQDADPQTWLETFLAATDLMLSAPYALPAYAAAGPTAYETIVDAKLAVATALSNEVAPILAGATGSAPAAVDALYQQMLVELASAYRTTAIVQFPVDVTSPPPAGATIAPRLFGPVATDAFTLPPGSTGPTGLAAFATQLGVAPAYLAQLVAGQRGLLAPGMTVEYAGKPYRIGSNDTLIDVAAQFGVTFPAGPSAGWWTQTWTPFIEGSLTGGPSGIAEQPTVYATTPLQVTRIAREFGRGEPFTAAADFFGDPIAFGRANQDLGAMFLAGCTIGFGPAGPTYVTTGAPSETIRTIAQALGDSDVDDVLTVMEASPLPPKLSGGTLQGAATTSGFTLSSTKLSLASGASPYLTFLLSVADASAARTLFLNTRFAPTDLEYAIATVPGAGAYESSSWLRFVIPPDEGFLPGSVMPQTQVPIPLREYPGPPILTGNSGTQENPNATTIACAKLWSYAFDVMRQEAAQDQDYVAASFYRSTRPANDLVAAFVLGDDLIAALAQFAFAWPALRDDLAPLPASPASPDLKAAVEAFAFYAAAIAVAMSSGQFANLMSGTNDPNLAERYEFSVRRAPGAELTGLNLTWTEATGPGASATAPWPQIAIVAGLAGPSGPVDPLTGPLPPVGATAAVYRYPPGYLADERLTQRYAFGGRDVARNERASGGAFVTRNAELISSGPIGAAGSTGPYGTNPKFIYQTPLVEFIDPLVPSLTCTTPIDLAPPGTAPQPLWAFIAQMLDAITSNAVADGLSAHWIELLCSYQFSTSGTDDGIFATIPLGLRPTPASGMTPPYDAYARELAAAIYAALPPGVLTTGGKRLSFAARLFTNIPDPNGAAELKPVLSYDDLFVRAAMITSPT